MMKNTEIEALLSELEEASTAYYNGEEPTMTDDDFDEKQNYLELSIQAIENEELVSRIETVIGKSSLNLGGEVTTVKEVIHANPMLSLDKAKTEEEVEKFVKKLMKNGATSFSLQLKLDGFAMAALYKNGELQQLATRGDGVTGENVTYLAYANDVIVLGLPTKVNTLEEFEVRGELFLDDSQFAAVNARRLKLTGENFKNSRNAVVGLMKKAEKGVDYPVEFTFSSYSLYKGGELANLELESASNEFITVNQLTKNCTPGEALNGIDNLPNLHTAIDKFGKLREAGFIYPTDGVVVKPDNEAEMHRKFGNTSHHPASQVAFKYPTPTVESTILNIVVSVGKTGKVTPRAIITPADLMGTVIRNVSLHNFAWMEEKDIRIGSKVAVTRANEVIPYIKSVIFNSDETAKMAIPTICPSCTGPLLSEDGIYPPKTLRCNNKECPSRFVFALRSAVGKNFLNIDGMSVVSIDHLNEEGILTDISDLYKLDLEILANSTLGYSENGNPRRMGEKRAQNILDHIEKSKELPLQRLLPSLSIQSLGNRVAKDLVKTFKNLDGVLNATTEQIELIDGFGEVRAQLIVDGLKHMRPVIDRMIEAGVKFNSNEAATAETSHSKIIGKSFAISGPVPEGYGNRNQWVEWLESQGAEFHSAPKPTTDYMIADSTGSSSKVKKAVQLGIMFVTAEEFKTLL